MINVLTMLTTGTVALCVLMAPKAVTAIDSKRIEVAVGNATQGFNILAEDYTKFSLLDVLSLEWQYFMVHAEPAFTGIVAVLLSDPRRRIPLLTPTGGNAVIAGKFGTGDCDNEGTYCVAEYVNTGKNTEATAYPEMLYFQGSKTANNVKNDFSMSVVEKDKILFTGLTQNAAWDLLIELDWKDREPFPPVTGRDLGTIPSEFWTVNMLWPRTTISGTMVNKQTGTTYELGDGLGEVKAHGYRENSFGRWLFAFDGWDFAIFSSQESQVQVAWQSYHKGKDLDFVDVSFPEKDGSIKTLKFLSKDGEAGWFHNDWYFNKEARQCVPTDGVLEAANSDYYLHAEIDIGKSQVPILSNASPITTLYVIMEWMPMMHGTIYRQKTGEVVASFSGVAGGEISYLRSILKNQSKRKCIQWGKPTFMAPLKVPISVPGVNRNQCAQLNSGRWLRDMFKCIGRKDCRWAMLRKRCF